jgi:hypothetical protein
MYILVISPLLPFQVSVLVNAFNHARSTETKPNSHKIEKGGTGSVKASIGLFIPNVR